MSACRSCRFRAARFSITAARSPRRPGCRPGSSSASCRRPGRRRRRSRSPNDRPGIALIGCGGMGRGDLKSASRFGNVVALCDVDVNHAAAVAKQYRRRPDAAEQVTDFRRVLDRKDVDIIINATPDHWHTLINLAAAAAKKDIYAEKPLTLTIDEGKQRGQGGAQGEGRAADRHAAAQQQAVPAGVRAGAQRTARQAHAGDGLRAGGPARGTVHSRCRCRTASTGTTGSARRRRWTT